MQVYVLCISSAAHHKTMIIIATYTIIIHYSVKTVVLIIVENKFFTKLHTILSVLVRLKHQFM